MLKDPYEPCPCGNGKKYKFCCQMQDRNAADARRRAQRDAERKLVDETIALDELSNRANTLIRKRKWEQAGALCAEICQRFPDATDGDERLAQLYRTKGQFAEAKTHTLSALTTAEAHPDKFDQDLVDALKAEIAYLDECIAAGRLVD